MANFQVRLDQVIDSEVIYNITYWEFPADDVVTLQEFADALRTSYVDNTVGKFASAWTLEGITLRQMDGGGAFTFFQPFTDGPLPGDNLNHLLPFTNALLVSTGYVGSRPNRGRIYFGGLTEAANNPNGRWDEDSSLDFEAMVQEWRDGLSTSAGSVFLRIARPDFDNNVWELSNPVNTVASRRVPATMRSRRPS